MAPAFEYAFPSIRGIQAGREYYVSMCPLRLIPKIFYFDEEEVSPELRAQRVLNRSRVPEISRYLLRHPKSYVFSAITASIDAKVKFEPTGQTPEERSIGTLRVPMSARFIVNDGQHRRAAIEQALKENADLCDETIAVVFFLDVGLKRSQQMFADLNRYAVRPTRSLSILYDHRDDWSTISKALMRNVPIFAALTETERSSISNRSIKLFTLSGIYYATLALLENHKKSSAEERMQVATDFWNAVAERMPDWQLAKSREISAAELRRDYVHSHAIALQAIGRMGATLLDEHPKDWKKKLAGLEKVDWAKQNAKLWEGRAMIGGRIQKTRVNVVLTSSVIKQALKVPLTHEEQEAEKRLKEMRNAQAN